MTGTPHPTGTTPQAERARMLWLSVLRRALKDEVWAWIESPRAAEVCQRAGVSVERLRREARERRDEEDAEDLPEPTRCKATNRRGMRCPAQAQSGRHFCERHDRRADKFKPPAGWLRRRERARAQ